MKIITTLLLAAAVGCAAVSCQKKTDVKLSAVEDTKAKEMMQGVWIDDETQEVNFMVKGHPILYPDSTSQPAFFKVVNDTLVVGEPPSRYPIVKFSAAILVFKNQNGEELKLTKSNSPDDNAEFEQHKHQPFAVTTRQLKKDTVVTLGGERYHCYVAINPTKYKVLRRVFNDDGVAVDNVYYDNIIHLSVYRGAEKIYSSDITKKLYASKVPADFLNQSILGDMNLSRADSDGFHFETVIGIPEATTSYVLDTTVSKDGKIKVGEMK